MRQQLRRLAQPQLVEPQRKTCAGLEQQLVDIALRKPGGRGQFLRRKIRLGKTLLQDHQYALEPHRTQSAAPRLLDDIAARTETERGEVEQMRGDGKARF